MIYIKCINKNIWIVCVNFVLKTYQNSKYYGNLRPTKNDSKMYLINGFLTLQLLLIQSLKWKLAFITYMVYLLPKVATKTNEPMITE
jgi:hypothetical protein